MTGYLRYRRVDEWNCQHQKPRRPEQCRLRMGWVGKRIHPVKSVVELSTSREIQGNTNPACLEKLHGLYEDWDHPSS